MVYFFLEIKLEQGGGGMVCRGMKVVLLLGTRCEQKMNKKKKKRCSCFDELKTWENLLFLFFITNFFFGMEKISEYYVHMDKWKNTCKSCEGKGIGR